MPGCRITPEASGKPGIGGLHVNWVLPIGEARRSERARPFPSSLRSLAGDFARVPSTAAHDLAEDAERPVRMPDSSEDPLLAPAPVTPKPGGVPRRGNARAGIRTQV